MSGRASRVHSAAEEAAHLLELTERAAQAENLEGLAQRVLPILMRVMGATGAILCLEEPKPPFHSLFHEGFNPTPCPPSREFAPSDSSKFRSGTIPLP